MHTVDSERFYYPKRAQGLVCFGLCLPLKRTCLPLNEPHSNIVHRLCGTVLLPSSLLFFTHLCHRHLMSAPYVPRLLWWLRQQRIRPRGRRPRFDPWVRNIPWRREWLPTPVFLPGKFHGQKSPAGCSSCGCKEWTQLSNHHFHFQTCAKDSGVFWK